MAVAPAGAPALPTPAPLPPRRAGVVWASLPHTVRALVRWRPTQLVGDTAFAGAAAAIGTFLLHYGSITHGALANRAALFAASACLAGCGLSVVAARMR